MSNKSWYGVQVLTVTFGKEHMNRVLTMDTKIPINPYGLLGRPQAPVNWTDLLSIRQKYKIILQPDVQFGRDFWASNTGGLYVVYSTMAEQCERTVTKMI